ncbi:MAG TPA: ABC transporter substrate-binding protein [Candidatus Sulfotelmatobacter sp.]|nr:ABC transporter substrate-binding protein [Candidatus Sulfotelmatobacter sp.]
MGGWMWGAALALALGWAAGAAGPAAAQALPKWRTGIVFVKADSVFHQLIGKEKGFHQAYGLDVEFVVLPGDTDVMRSVVAGATESIEITPASPLTAIEKGAKLKIVASFMPGLNYVLFSKRDVKDLQDLYGRTVAVTAPNSFPELLLRTAMQRQGLDPTKVQLVQAGGDPDRVKALLGGKVDAAVAAIEFLHQVERADRKLLVDFAEVLPQWTRNVVVTTDQIIKERPDHLRRFLLAKAKGVRYTLEHRDDTIAIMAKVSKQDPAEAAWVYDWFVRKKLMQPNGYVSPAALNWMQELNVRLGRQSKVLPTEQVATWEFQRDIVKELGEYKW